MKKISLLLALLTLGSLIQHSAFAFTSEDDAEFTQGVVSAEDAAAPADAQTQVDPADANAEFLQKLVDKVRGTGTWGFDFVLIKPTGESEVITHYRENSLIKPASTMKLFTAWMSFEKKTQTNYYLGQMLKWSINQYAFDTLTGMGGVSAYKPFFADTLTLNATNFKPVDGAGLSHSNRVTAQLEVDLLKTILKSSDYDEFKDLMVQPGQGTLLEEHRFTEFEYPLYAKTGTLGETASLAGFAELPQGTLVFSMISNQLKISLASARKIIDKAVKDHADFIVARAQAAEQSAAAPIPAPTTP